MMKGICRGKDYRTRSMMKDICRGRHCMMNSMNRGRRDIVSMDILLDCISLGCDGCDALDCTLLGCGMILLG
jgi:hypothetical protein